MGFERGIVVEKVNVVVLGGGDVRERRTKAVTVAAESEERVEHSMASAKGYRIQQ